MLFQRSATTVALAAALCAACTVAFAADDSKYPEWRGQWRRPPGVGIQWDPTKPPGLGQQAPLTPEYQAMLEASIRKVTVKVIWSEGSTERDLSVTQYLTNPQQGGFLAEDESAAGAAGTTGVGAGATSGTNALILSLVWSGKRRGTGDGNHSHSTITDGVQTSRTRCQPVQRHGAER